ncbi:hypothetical protein FOL47_008847 [Perkinsus chesapeaki]|uniref:Uncharacterized protein n=1 Tax=Perkinsus chesapeaki TaxID=330153 RepID=A0A7J6LBH9_PERCH|nr:hypothetical protein FOL47_008847 [Perkinsus chesapeaki]
MVSLNYPIFIVVLVKLLHGRSSRPHKDEGVDNARCLNINRFSWPRPPVKEFCFDARKDYRNVWHAQLKYSTWEDPTLHTSSWVPMTRGQYKDADGEDVNYIEPCMRRVDRGDKSEVEEWFKRLGKVWAQPNSFTIRDVRIVMDFNNPSRIGKETTVIIGSKSLVVEAKLSDKDTSLNDRNVNANSRKRSHQPAQPEVPRKIPQPSLVPQSPPIFMKASEVDSGVYRTLNPVHGNLAVRTNIIHVPRGGTFATIHFIKSNEENPEAAIGPVRLIDDWNTLRVDDTALPEARLIDSLQRVNRLLEKISINPISIEDITLSVGGPRQLELYLGRLRSSRPARTFKLYHD